LECRRSRRRERYKEKAERQKKLQWEKSFANTLPVISINYTKLIKGFKKLQATIEDFGRIFTRMLPIPFQKREGKQTISQNGGAEEI